MSDPASRREVPGAPGYTVASNGDIYGVRSKPLTRTFTRTGQPTVSIKFEGRHTHKTVASIVCLAFHGPRPSTDHYAVYLNGDRTDARPENVAWRTAAEFHIFGPPRKPPTGRAALTEADIETIRASGERAVDLAAKYGVTPKVIWSTRSGRGRGGL